MTSRASEVWSRRSVRLDLGGRWATWRGVVGDGALHRHFAAQAVIAATPLRVFDPSGAAASGRCILIDPLAPHRLERGVEAELFFIEPFGDVAPALRARLLDAAADGPTVLVSTGRHRYWAHPPRGGGAGASLAGAQVARALAAVDAAVGRGPVPLAVAAQAAGLSPSRLRHLLVEHVGVTHRRYALWARLRLALAGLAAGRDLTTSAHVAGFSDAAHLARTLKRTFGVTAGQALLGARAPAAAFKRGGAHAR